MGTERRDDKQRAEAERIAWDTIKEYGCHLPERNDVKLAKAFLAAVCVAPSAEGRRFHIGAQNDQLYIISGEAPALNNDYPNHDADRTCIAKVYDEAEARRLVDAANGVPSATGAPKQIIDPPGIAVEAFRRKNGRLPTRPGDHLSLADRLELAAQACHAAHLLSCETTCRDAVAALSASADRTTTAK